MIVQRLIGGKVFTSNNNGVIDVFTEKELNKTKKGRKIKALWLKSVQNG